MRHAPSLQSAASRSALTSPLVLSAIPGEMIAEICNAWQGAPAGTSRLSGSPRREQARLRLHRLCHDSCLRRWGPCRTVTPLGPSCCEAPARASSQASGTYSRAAAPLTADKPTDITAARTVELWGTALGFLTAAKYHGLQIIKHRWQYLWPLCQRLCQTEYAADVLTRQFWGRPANSQLAAHVHQVGACRVSTTL